MPTAPPIVTVAELVELADGQIKGPLSKWDGAGAPPKAAARRAEAALRAAESYGEAYLDGPLHVRAASLPRPPAAGGPPVVAVTETATAEDGTETDVAGFVGWRNAGHTLDELKTFDGLGDLAALPPPLPADVQAAIVEHATFILNRRAGGHVGRTSVTTQVGQNQHRTERGFSLSEVNRLTGRGTEIAAIWDTYCGARAPVSV